MFCSSTHRLHCFYCDHWSMSDFSNQSFACKSGGVFQIFVSLIDLGSFVGVPRHRFIALCSLGQLVDIKDDDQFLNVQYRKTTENYLTSHQIISLLTIHFLYHQFSRKLFVVYWLLYSTLATLMTCFLMSILVRTKSPVCPNVILQPVMRLTNVSDKYWLHKKVIVRKPTCAPSCFRSFPNIAFETVTMFVWLTVALTYPLRKIIKHFLLTRLSPPSNGWCDVLDYVPAGSV